MSAHTDQHAQHGHADHAHHDEGGHAESTLKGYAIGFVLSVILTAIPFWLVMDGVIADKGTLALTLLGFGAVQIIVHMVYFLHMNSKSEGGWTMLSTIFTVVLVVITLSGSLWVMFHMNTNMMGGHTHEMPQHIE
ncbi:MAG TPA: cytochrome o ubiquinol oxidase subunit IV [Candidatus Aquabacterium excrementipullorum]|nr:cytochrome o ubiquinol oxidase subunit IV [Candidatus Aquabacterium excrementipullorum]